MGISYVVMVQLKLTLGKCLKDDQGPILKVVLGDLLRDLPGEKEGTKGMKIRIVREKKSNPASEKGRIKRTR